MKDQDAYFVYVLRSLSDGKRYIGLSKSLYQRLEQHNAGRVKSTRSRIPFVLIHEEKFNTLADARKREKYLKTSAGRRWLEKARL